MRNLVNTIFKKILPGKSDMTFCIEKQPANLIRLTIMEFRLISSLVLMHKGYTFLTVLKKLSQVGSKAGFLLPISITICGTAKTHRNPHGSHTRTVVSKHGVRSGEVVLTVMYSSWKKD